LAAREAHYQKCPKQSGDGYSTGNLHHRMYSVKLNGLFQAFDTAGETLLNGLVLAAEKFWSLVSS